jgi:cobalt-zinc-cadmium resistance protein CzcA
MIKKVIHFCVFNPGIIIVVVLFCIGMGVVSFLNLPIDAVPDITNTQVQIITRVDGLVPEEIERKVTFPIESVLSGILGAEQTRSVTRFGISHITIVFAEKMDIYRARQLVTERLTTIIPDLPPGVTPELGPITTGLGEIYHYQVEAKEKKTGKERIRQLMDIRAVQDWFVRPRLLKVKGVTEINTIGGYEKQFHLQPNFAQMERFAVHFEDIANAVEKNNLSVGGGYVEKGIEQYLIQADGLLKNIEDIENLPVKLNKSLDIIKVKDVAKVRLAEELRNGAALVNGEEAVLGTVMMMLGENSRKVATNVALEVEKISKNLPEGFIIKPLYNRSVMVDATLSTVEKNLLFGCALVVIFLFLLVGNVQASLIVALVIPVSLLITFILMKVYNISGNLMSFGCLDFGIIIDSAVIVVDATMRAVMNFYKKTNRKLTRDEIKHQTVEATSHVFKEAFFGQLIIIIVFIPLFALSGVEGKMFTPIATTFVFALIAALVLSLTFVPALCGLFLPGKISLKKPWLMKIADAVFGPVFENTLIHKKKVLLAALVVVSFSFFIFSKMGGEFIPQLDEGSLALDIIRPAEIATSESVRQHSKTDKAILQFKEVEHTFSRIGTSSIPADPNGINLGDTIVMLHPKEDWPKSKNGRARTKTELVNEISDAVKREVPTQTFITTQPMQMRFNDLLEGIRADVSIKVFGPDIGELEKISRNIKDAVSHVSGTGNVQLQLKDRVPLFKVTSKIEEMRKLGFGSSTILESVSKAYQGERLGTVYEGVQRFPIMMRLDLEKRKDQEYLKNLPVGFSDELHVPFKKVADFKFEKTFHTIFRENGERRTAVLISLKDRDVESYVYEAMKSVADKVKIPSGYSIEWGGNFKNLQNAKSSLGFLVPITLAIIFFIIYMVFNNSWHALIIFSCVPLSLVGGILLLWAMGMTFSVSAGVGFIALFGISVLNGVILISHYRELQTEGHSILESVKNGTKTLLRPILMTALVDAFGFLPMMLATGLGAEVQKPLATVVVGGIISATILALLVLPLMYLIYEEKAAQQQKILSRSG